jgi:radical SAM-linked protein
VNRGPDRETAPVVQRIRFRYSKTGPLRFSSHRDFQRAFERALRRASVPMAYSAGFNPHPKVSYANAVATGVASHAEYVEIGLASECDPEGLRVALDAALPRGLDVVEMVTAHTPDLVGRLEASLWSIELAGLEPQDLHGPVEALLAAEHVEVERMMKTGPRRFDAREAVVDLRVMSEEPGQGCAILGAVVRHVTPSVRPDDVLAALRLVADLVPPVVPSVTRLAQGPLVTGDAGTTSVPLDALVGDPLDPDRAAERERNEATVGT